MAIRQRGQTGGTTGDAGDMGMGPAAFAAGASVALSWYYFFVKGDREMGLFVGLWPPTILAFASQANQRAMRQDIQRVTQQPGTMIRDTIENVVGSR